MRRAAGEAFEHWGPSTEVDYGAGSPAKIDGTVGSDIAVEVESRTGKQIRGAVMDLVFHPYPKKLLVILPAHQNDPEIEASRCRNILNQLANPDKCRVIVLTGNGAYRELDADLPIVSAALSELGFEIGT